MGLQFLHLVPQLREQDSCLRQLARLLLLLVSLLILHLHDGSGVFKEQGSHDQKTIQGCPGLPQQLPQPIQLPGRGPSFPEILVDYPPSSLLNRKTDNFQPRHCLLNYSAFTLQ